MLNLVETVFVFSANDADFALRYFTSSKEIPVAGHPTIAALIDMEHTQMIDINAKKRYRIRTFDGIREVMVEKKSGKVYMKQSKPSFSPFVKNRREVAQILGITEQDLIADLPFKLLILD